MRVLMSIVVAAGLAAAVLAGRPTEVTYAAFHCMRIHAVKAGFGGNPNVQYVELRMDAIGQQLVAGHTMQFLDGSGTLKATFTFPANVANSAKGDSILVATADFNAVSQGGGADFLFSNGNTVASNGGDPLHPMQSPNGKIVWAQGSQNCGLTFPVDSLATGTATADFGTAAGPLSPASDNRATRLSNLNAAPTNNSTEYSLQAVATSSFAVPFANLATDFTTPRNNGRLVLNLATSPIVPSVGGVARPPDASNGSADAATRDGGRDRDLMAYAVAVATLLIIPIAGVFVVHARRQRAARHHSWHD